METMEELKLSRKPECLKRMSLYIKRKKKKICKTAISILVFAKAS